MEKKILELEEKRVFQKFTLMLIKRKGNIAMYGKYDGDDLISIEVIKIRVLPIGKLIANSEKYKGYTHYEAYPSSEQFGLYGWDICGVDKEKRAFAKFEELTNATTLP